MMHDRRKQRRESVSMAGEGIALGAALLLACMGAGGAVGLGYLVYVRLVLWGILK
jgi:hypothetical protein